MNCWFLYMVLPEKGGSWYKEWIRSLNLEKWHFIELRESTVLRSYSDNANLSEWKDLVYLFIHARVRRRLCAIFSGISMVFAYNDKPKLIMRIYFLCLPILMLSAVQHNTLYLTHEVNVYLENVWNSLLCLIFFQKPTAYSPKSLFILWKGFLGKYFDLTVVKDLKISINFL